MPHKTRILPSNNLACISSLTLPLLGLCQTSVCRQFLHKSTDLQVIQEGIVLVHDARRFGVSERGLWHLNRLHSRVTQPRIRWVHGRFCLMAVCGKEGYRLKLGFPSPFNSLATPPRSQAFLDSRPFDLHP